MKSGNTIQFRTMCSIKQEKGEIALIGYKVRTDYEWRLDFDKVILCVH